MNIKHFMVVSWCVALGCSDWESLRNPPMSDSGVLDSGTPDSEIDSGVIVRNRCVNSTDAGLFDSENMRGPMSLASAGSNHIWVHLTGAMKGELVKQVFIGEDNSFGVDFIGLTGRGKPGYADPSANNGNATFAFPFSNIDGGKQVVLVDPSGSFRVQELIGFSSGEPQIASVFLANTGVPTWSVWGDEDRQFVQNVGPLSNTGATRVRSEPCGSDLTFEDVAVLPITAGARAVLSVTRNVRTGNCSAPNLASAQPNVDNFLYTIDRAGVIGNATRLDGNYNRISLGAVASNNKLYVAYSSGFSGTVRWVSMAASGDLSLAELPGETFYFSSPGMFKFGDIVGTASGALYVSFVSTATYLDIAPVMGRATRFPLPGGSRAYIARLQPNIEVIDLGTQAMPMELWRIPIVATQKPDGGTGIAALWAKSPGENFLNYIPDAPATSANCVEAP